MVRVAGEVGELDDDRLCVSRDFSHGKSSAFLSCLGATENGHGRSCLYVILFKKIAYTPLASGYAYRLCYITSGVCNDPCMNSMN